MSGHNLMQAIARVNRVFKDKQGGLVVDDIGIAENFKEALAQYTDSDKKTTGVDTDVLQLYYWRNMTSLKNYFMAMITASSSPADPVKRCKPL